MSISVSKHIRYHWLKHVIDSVIRSIADDTPCENGWVGFAGSCYWFETSKMDFNDSLAHCLSINSSLASLDTENVIAFAREFIVGNFIVLSENTCNAHKNVIILIKHIAFLISL